MEQIGVWCDQVELWVAGLPFVLQLSVVALVLVPLSFGLAWLMDEALSFAARITAPRKPAAAPVRSGHEAGDR